MVELSDFDRGLLIGLLIGEGSFGGDGKQPQVTLRMHVRHEAVFIWLTRAIPPVSAVRALSPRRPPLLPVDGPRRAAGGGPAAVPRPRRDRELDAHAAERIAAMCDRYAGYIARHAPAG